MSQIPLDERDLRRGKGNGPPLGEPLNESPRCMEPNKNGSGSWIRTSDQVVNSHLLYR